MIPLSLLPPEEIGFILKVKSLGCQAVSPMPRTSPRKPIEVFFSYSHRDEALRDELAKHLSILKQQGIIDVWYDREVTAGSEWESTISSHLNSADVILLLISADFLASQYCYDIELRRVLERHSAKEARVIPIILRPVDWSGALFSKLQALPRNSKAITTWTNQDEAFTDVAQGIRRAIEDLTQQGSSLKSKRNPTPPGIKLPTSYSPKDLSDSHYLPPCPKPSQPSRTLPNIAWGAIAFIPFVWLIIGASGLQDTSSDTQDWIGKFVVGNIGGLLSGVLGATTWHSTQPTVALEQLLIYVLLYSLLGGFIWSALGGGNWLLGLFIGLAASSFTYWWIYRVSVRS